MIVNPQLINYRLIIGSLIVAIAVLTVFSFTSYQSIQAHQHFLEQEKKLVETELSQMIKSYDGVSIENDLITSKLTNAKNDTKLILDSLRLLRSELSVISKFKQQVIALKSKNLHLFKTIDSLDNINVALNKEKLLAYNELTKQRNANSSLLKENKSLNKTIEKGAVLTANSFSAKAFRNLLGTPVITNKASKAESIEVCFTIAENSLTEQGDKEIYIQIVNPSNNVFADKGAINFGESSLIYSTKKVVSYNNQVIDVCIDIKAEEDDQPLISGNYYINVFHKDRQLGSTQIKLN